MATIAMFVALGGGAYALTGIPGRGGVFHGCVSHKTGVLRVVKSSSSCVKPRTHGKHRTRGEFAVEWNQRGRPGAPGRPGPRAVKLYFDRAPDNQLVTLGSVGPWTIRAQCGPGAASVPAPVRLFADGPGSADLAYTEKVQEGTILSGQDHTDLTTDDTVFSFREKGGNADRFVGTIVLSADPATPVVEISFVAVEDALTPGGHCTMIGAATPRSLISRRRLAPERIRVLTEKWLYGCGR